MNYAFVTGLRNGGLAFLKNEAGVEVPVRITEITSCADYPTEYKCEEVNLWTKENPHIKKNPSLAINVTISKVIFNDPATIVFWSDDTKTVVKAQNDEPFDPEKGLAMAMAKRAFGNNGNYYNHIKKWTDKYCEDQSKTDRPSEKTDPIKTLELCMRCGWSDNRRCEKQNSCLNCPHTYDGFRCLCLKVPFGEPCPYFEEVKNGD